MAAVIGVIAAWRLASVNRVNRILLVCVSLSGVFGLVQSSSAQTVGNAPSIAQTSTSAEQSQILDEEQSAKSRELLHILNQLNEMKSELKLLRNTIEEMGFENQNAKRRQEDLFQDIDRRLTDLESGQLPVASQNADAEQNNPQDDAESDSQNEAAQAVVVPDGSVQSSDEAPESGSDPSQPDQDEEPGDETLLDGTNVVSIEQQDAYDKAFELLKKSRYEEAIQGFRELADNWPSSQLADDAYYWMSEALYLNREFEQALFGFNVIIERYADSDRLPDAMLKTGYIYYDVGEYTSAAETFRSILERFPDHRVSISAQTRLRRIEQSIQ